MTLLEIKQRAYFLSGSDVNSYKDASLLLSLNVWNNNLTTLIMRKSGTWQYEDSNLTGYNVFKGDLLAGQKEYPVPLNTLNIRRVEINGIEAKVINEQQLTSLDSSNGFTIKNPRYEIRSGAIHLYPTPPEGITKGLTFMIDRNAYQFTLTDLTAGTKEPGYDLSYHDMLATGIAWDWAKTKRKEVAKDLANDLANYSINLGLDYSSKVKDEDLKMQAEIINYD